MTEHGVTELFNDLAIQAMEADYLELRIELSWEEGRKVCGNCDGTGDEFDYGGPWDCAMCDGTGWMPGWA